MIGPAGKLPVIGFLHGDGHEVAMAPGIRPPDEPDPYGPPPVDPFPDPDPHPEPTPIP